MSCEKLAAETDQRGLSRIQGKDIMIRSVTVVVERDSEGAQDVIDAALIDQVKDEPRVAWSEVKAGRSRGRVIRR